MVILLKDWFMVSIARLTRSIKPVYRSYVPMGWDSAHGVWFGGPRRLDFPRIPPALFSLMKDSIYVIII